MSEGFSDCIINKIKLYTWDGFNYPSSLGQKDTELHVPTVPKVKLLHLNRVVFIEDTLKNLVKDLFFRNSSKKLFSSR